MNLQSAWQGARNAVGCRYCKDALSSKLGSLRLWKYKLVYGVLGGRVYSHHYQVWQLGRLGAQSRGCLSLCAVQLAMTFRTGHASQSEAQPLSHCSSSATTRHQATRGEVQMWHPVSTHQATTWQLLQSARVSCASYTAHEVHKSGDNPLTGTTHCCGAPPSLPLTHLDLTIRRVPAGPGLPRALLPLTCTGQSCCC
jgi:hypothetical protein